jgi:hypothetical protein
VERPSSLTRGLFHDGAIGQDLITIPAAVKKKERRLFKRSDHHATRKAAELAKGNNNTAHVGLCPEGYPPSKAALIVLNVAEILIPSVLAPPTTATEISPTTMPYSTRVAPD